MGTGEFYTWIQRSGWGTYPDLAVAGPARTTDSAQLKNPILAEMAMGLATGTSLAEHPGVLGDLAGGGHGWSTSHVRNNRCVNITEVWADGHVELVNGKQVTLKFFFFDPWNAWY